MKTRVLLLSTVHPSCDPRIVYKIAPSLAQQYQVFCCLPEARQLDENPEINMIRLPHFRSLLFRLLFSHTILLWKCVRLKPGIVHVFVPELIPIAFIFKWLGAVVIYEVQENLYKKFSIKQYNNGKGFQALFKYFDQLARKRFFFIFTEHSYPEDYNDLKYPSAVVHNYVSLPFIDQYTHKRPLSDPPVFFYCGVLSIERCFDVMIEAFARLKSDIPDFTVHLFGPLRFTMAEAEQLPGFNLVRNHLNFYGYTDLRIALRYAEGATAGIALLKPVADYLDSYTTKLFEYMAMELPVLTSDFPLYRTVVEAARCGYCISPYSAELLAEKLLYLFNRKNEALVMGQNGRNAVEERYNWLSEEKILLSFYQKAEKRTFS
ncbi:hypothetical protein DYBT9275_04516 [Dyadobacter sp. CECT 9275]|uniref:Glycosyl transferase family 1 domain-containing protein n=1 Tax=Dyadobacter helix TaxID=2822344 RepID=A0A916JEK4_9BACT|nr:glycosyltransferase [Dyadobacter sp. CECT 9275]CAG5009517.1 hypothetical protein DYBT9275_04516 [Dyadobacter sp. CECT 9275]